MIICYAGFIMMTPQLFINYKMKSVAHLPWRMMTYKALNTFIDDMFAFIIKMPMMYRIGCLRDGTCWNACVMFQCLRHIFRVSGLRQLQSTGGLEHHVMILSDDFLSFAFMLCKIYSDGGWAPKARSRSQTIDGNPTWSCMYYVCMYGIWNYLANQGM